MGQSKAECKVGGIGWEVKVEVERLPYLTNDSGTASGGQHTSWRHAVMVEVCFGGVSAPLVPYLARLRGEEISAVGMVLEMGQWQLGKADSDAPAPSRKQSYRAGRR